MKRARAIGVGVANTLVIGLTLVFGDVSNAHAAPASLRVVGDDAACPAPAQVAAVLKRLLRQTQITAESGPRGPSDAFVSDEGAQYRVIVAGQERSFADPARACAERAQHAAVFVALVLDPPMIAEPHAEPPPTPPPPPPTAPEPRRPPPAVTPSGMSWDLALGGLVLAAPSVPSGKSALAGGAQVWIRGKRGWHIGFGSGVLHGTLRFDTVTADAWWIPLDFAGGYAARTGAWEFAAELGPSASVLSIAGENLRDARRQVRLEVGGRGSVFTRFWLSQKIALFLSGEAVLRPVPYVLRIAPDGEVGQMPAIWLGGAAGLSASLE